MIKIKEFNELYEMYMKKSKEDLAMLLTLRDTNEDKGVLKIDIKDFPGQSAMEGIKNYGKNIYIDPASGKEYDNTPIESKKPVDDRLKLDDPDMFRVHLDPDMFKIHPDADMFKVQPEDIIFTNKLDTYCSWRKDHKCIRGNNNLCDGCGHMPSLYTATSTAEKVDWATNTTINC